MSKEEIAIEKYIKWLENEIWFMGDAYRKLALMMAKEILQNHNPSNQK